MTIVSSDRDEQNISALAEVLRRGVAAGSSDEDLDVLARAALGDDDAEDPAEVAGDDPHDAETWFG